LPRHTDCADKIAVCIRIKLISIFFLDVDCVDRDTGGDALSHDGGVSLSPLSPEAVAGETRRYWDIRHSATHDALSRHAVRDTKGIHPQLQR
jgi:hypothetical protein